jgi:hypothetical protein
MPGERSTFTRWIGAIIRPGIGEEAGYVFAPVGKACDGLCGRRLAALTCFVHKGAPRIYTPTGCGFAANNCLNTYCKIPPLA